MNPIFAELIVVTKVSVANVKTEFKSGFFSIFQIYTLDPPVVMRFHGVSFQDPDLVMFCQFQLGRNV